MTAIGCARCSAPVVEDCMALDCPHRREQQLTDLRGWRLKMGFNTYQAAKALGISRSTLHLIERGDRPISRTVYLAMQALIERAARCSQDDGSRRPFDRTQTAAELRALRFEAARLVLAIDRALANLAP